MPHAVSPTAWLLALALPLAACVTEKPPLTGASEASPLTSSERPLDFALKRFPDGSIYRLSSDRGSVVLLDVWATWCDPCREALPLYDDLRKEYAARGLKVYAINVDADSREIPGFLTLLKVALPVLLDPEARYAGSELKVKVMPTTLLIDRRGLVRHVHEGFAEEHLQKYLAEIEALLAERAP